ncbi:MAG: glycosyltransferase family 1 protein [bacterium]|nr:MAG: glycosyltransferase family 1 protein [bacterium]
MRTEGRDITKAREWLQFQRIGLLTDTFDEINGVTNTYHQLVRYAREHEVRLDLFCPSQDDDSDEKLDTVTIHRVKQAAKIPFDSDLGFDLKIISPRIGMYFVKNRFDLIHASSPGNMGLQALTLSYYHRLPLVGVYHTALPEYAEERALKLGKRIIPQLKSTGFWENITWRFVTWFYNKCDLVLSPSNHIREVLEGKLESEVSIFSRGIDLEQFNPRRRERRNGVNVLYVGRVAVEKGLDDLAHCFRDIDDANLIFVGDGPYRAELESTGRENFIFKGYLRGEALGTEYASADLFVFPSKTDTFGNVVLEAMASGLPVIVTDRMAPRELIEDGVNGFIVKDRSEMKERIGLLMRDGGLRKRMGKASRRLAEQRTWDSVFDKLFEDYFSVKMNYDYARKCKLFEPFSR